MSIDAAAKMARIVYVLPEPVCPYISTVEGRDVVALSTRGRTLSVYTAAESACWSKTLSKRNDLCSTYMRRQSAWSRQSCTAISRVSQLTTSNSPWSSSCLKNGRRRTATRNVSPGS
eukprot:1671978-Prymnesium_polylepis.1